MFYVTPTSSCEHTDENYRIRRFDLNASAGEMDLHQMNVCMLRGSLRLLICNYRKRWRRFLLRKRLKHLWNPKVYLHFPPWEMKMDWHFCIVLAEILTCKCVCVCVSCSSSWDTGCCWFLSWRGGVELRVSHKVPLNFHLLQHALKSIIFFKKNIYLFIYCICPHTNG